MMLQRHLEGEQILSSFLVPGPMLFDFVANAPFLLVPVINTGVRFPRRVRRIWLECFLQDKGLDDVFASLLAQLVDCSKPPFSCHTEVQISQ